MEKLTTIAKRFMPQGDIVSVTPYGNGHINDTYLVENTVEKPIILQQINTHVFPNVKMMQDNIYRVTTHIANYLENAVSSEHLLRIISSSNGQLYYENERGSWRAYNFIPNSIGYETVKSPHMAYSGGKAFGQFQKMLSNLPGDPLYEVIDNFHNMKFRLDKFNKALSLDVKERASSVPELIDFVQRRAEKMCILLELGEKGEIPVRITHNDTKLNNILFDKDTHEVLSVIDLDTVMNGYVHYDFGDSIRTYANAAVEDEPDLSKVYMKISMFEAYARGYLGAIGKVLTETEIAYLAPSAAIMTFIIGLRFITDYLDGDVYFKTAHEHHNLQRAKAQFKLVESIEKQMSDMQRIISDICRYL